MRLLPKLFKRSAAPATPNPADDRWYSTFLTAFGGKRRKLTPEAMLSCAAFINCVQVLAKTIAALPLNVYEKDPDSAVRNKASEHPLYYMLHDSPSPWLTSFEFREMMIFHIFLHGNFYAQKAYRNDGSLAFLLPLNPERVEPKVRDNGQMVYQFRNNAGVTRILEGEDVFHIKFISLDGVKGVSPITYAANVIPLAQGLEEFSIRFFENNASPAGVLEHPGKLGDKAYAKLKESWSEAHQGVENAHKIAILEDGMKFTAMSVTNVDAQHIENRKFSRVDICGLCGVPPHMIQDLERATFSNIEHQDLAFGKHTIVPICERIEQAIHLRLFNETERPLYFAEFLLEGLLRGDFKTRQEGFQVMRLNGIISADEWRAKENLAPLPDGQGKTYIVPSNMMNLEHAKDQGPSSPVGEKGKEPEKKLAINEEKSIRATEESLANLFTDRVSHILTKELKTVESCRKKPDPQAAFNEFIEAHKIFLTTNLRAFFDHAAVACQLVGRSVDAQEALQNYVDERILSITTAFAENKQPPTTALRLTFKPIEPEQTDNGN